jgi:hypothetical protein
MFAGTLAATLVCVLVLPGLLRRAGMSAEHANGWSAGAWFALLLVFIYPVARAAVQPRGPDATPPGRRGAGPT